MRITTTVSVPAEVVDAESERDGQGTEGRVLA
jgi:hypothetical protein